MDEGRKELTAELYRLYWDSDRSVRQIREELDITSAALYELLEPLPVDAACQVCGGAVGFKNRTARTNREGICLRCGEVMRVPAEKAAAAEAEDGAATEDAVTEDGAAAEDGAGADGAPPESEPDWVSDAVDDALESTERAVRDVLFVAVGLVAVLAVGVVGLLRRRG